MALVVFKKIQSDPFLKKLDWTSPDHLLWASKAHGSLQVLRLSDQPAHWQTFMGESNGYFPHSRNWQIFLQMYSLTSAQWYPSSPIPLIAKFQIDNFTDLFKYTSKLLPAQEVVTKTSVPVPEFEKQPTLFSIWP